VEGANSWAFADVAVLGGSYYSQFVKRRSQRFESARRLSFSYFSMILHKETDLGELNAELVGEGDDAARTRLYMIAPLYASGGQQRARVIQ
jgi:hypothetical protein